MPVDRQRRWQRALTFSVHCAEEERACPGKDGEFACSG